VNSYVHLMRDTSVAPCVRIAAAKLLLGERYALHPSKRVQRLSRPLPAATDPKVLRRA
jgi:hypothetical protein